MKARIVISALAVTAALAVAACGSSSPSKSSSSSGGATAPGVTATSITFGTHQPVTGPAAPGYSEIAPASQAYFDYVNAHGGVYGRKIHLIIKDDMPPCHHGFIPMWKEIIEVLKKQEADPTYQFIAKIPTPSKRRDAKPQAAVGGEAEAAVA